MPKLKPLKRVHEDLDESLLEWMRAKKGFEDEVDELLDEWFQYENARREARCEPLALVSVDSIQTLIDLQSKYDVLSQWSLFDAAVSMEEGSNMKR
jgi:hypothetical protein